MTRRKGEITRPDLNRKWQHHVALPIGMVRGLTNSEVVRGFADVLSVAPRTYSLRLAAEQRRALAALKNAGNNGATQDLLSAPGFDASIIAGLVEKGFATLTSSKARGR
jgi:hypothetical protein